MSRVEVNALYKTEYGTDHDDYIVFCMNCDRMVEDELSKIDFDYDADYWLTKSELD